MISCKIPLMLAYCLPHIYFFCQTWFTASQTSHMKSGKGRRLLPFPPFTFHRAQHKEQHSFISTDYTKLACCCNSSTEHMLNFLCIHNVVGSNKAEQYSLQYFLTYQDKKEPHNLSNRCLLLRYVFNHRRTNLINWEFLLCISNCCLWCLQWCCVICWVLPYSSKLEKRQKEKIQKSLLFPSSVFSGFRNRIN